MQVVVVVVVAFAAWWLLTQSIRSLNTISLPPPPSIPPRPHCAQYCTGPATFWKVCLPHACPAGAQHRVILVSIGGLAQLRQLFSSYLCQESTLAHWIACVIIMPAACVKGRHDVLQPWAVDMLLVFSFADGHWLVCQRVGGGGRMFTGGSYSALLPPLDHCTVVPSLLSLARCRCSLPPSHECIFGRIRAQPAVRGDFLHLLPLSRRCPVRCTKRCSRPHTAWVRGCPRTPGAMGARGSGSTTSTRGTWTSSCTSTRSISASGPPATTPRTPAGPTSRTATCSRCRPRPMPKTCCPWEPPRTRWSHGSTTSCRISPSALAMPV